MLKANNDVICNGNAGKWNTLSNNFYSLRKEEKQKQKQHTQSVM